MKTKTCQKCGNEMSFEDESFDYGEGHHGPVGTEIIQYWYCDKCEHEEDYEGEEEEDEEWQ